MIGLGMIVVALIALASGAPVPQTAAWLLLCLLATMFWVLLRVDRALARRRRENHLRFTEASEALCFIERDGVLSRRNRAFDALVGNTNRCGSDLVEMLHPDDGLELLELLQTLNGASPAREWRMAIDNDWRWLSFALTPEWHGDYVRFQAVVVDVSNRRHAEQALVEETAFRRAMEDSMSAGMRAVDLSGCITFVNRGLCNMLGCQPADLVGQVPPYSYWLEEDIEKNMLIAHSAIGSDATDSESILRARSQSGQVLHLRVSTSRLIDGGGAHVGWLSTLNDVTEAMRVREQLADAHDRFTTVLDELGAAVSVAPLYSPWGESLEAEPLHDKERQATLATRLPMLLFANRQYRREFGDGGLAHALLYQGWPWQSEQTDSEEVTSTEVPIPSTEQWFEVRTRRIRWVDGQPAVLLVATDITTRQRARELLEQQAERLQQTSRLVTMGEMASSIAHELNQPLAAITNYTLGARSRLLRESRMGVESQNTRGIVEVLEKAARQAQRAADVIRRVRDFARRSEPERRCVQIHEILDDALCLGELAARRNRLYIRTDIAPNIPPLNVDQLLIQQVLLNLMKNGLEAMQNMPGRTLTVTIEVIGDAVQFRVADRGIGLQDSTLNHLFEPFFTTKKEGMGIGLNICRSIIESHGGRIGASPNQPNGTVFHFTLPLKAMEPDSCSDRHRKPHDPSGSAPDSQTSGSQMVRMP